MEKIRALSKNEMHNEYLVVVKEKLDEIVAFINAMVGPELEDTVIEEDTGTSYNPTLK